MIGISNVSELSLEDSVELVRIQQTYERDGFLVVALDKKCVIGERIYFHSCEKYLNRYGWQVIGTSDAQEHQRQTGLKFVFPNWNYYKIEAMD